MKLTEILTAPLHAISDILLPNVCCACGQNPLLPHECICSECLINMERCVDSGDYSVLTDIIANAPAAPGITASWVRYRHTSLGARAIREAKYGHRPQLARDLGRLFAQELLHTRTSGMSLNDIQVLLPVPLHWTKQILRGYNQSEWICRGIAEVCGAEVRTDLHAVRRHATQTHRNDRQRIDNVRGIFALDPSHKLNGRHIAIVDDVITTGATVRECLLTIGRAGAKPASISILSLGLAGDK